MIKFEIYPKIRALNKCPEIFEEHDVIITEKIHGKNMRILIPENAKSINDIIIGAREYSEDHISFGLHSEAKMLRGLLDLERLLEYFKKENKQVILFGEFYGKGVQKGIKYRDDKGFIVFDIMIGDNFIEFDKIKSICNMIGLETVPILYRGKPDKEIFNKFININSALAKNNKIIEDSNLTEGVVIRSNPLNKNQYDEFVICKFKSDWNLEEKEVKEDKDLSKVNEFVERFVTISRVEKMIDKLKEKSLFTKTMKDIPNLGNEVTNDIFIEEKDEFSKLLTNDKLLNEKMIKNKIVNKTAEIFKTILG
jgi:Rnl2 family RNA ligase